jgi:large repetitive protein
MKLYLLFLSLFLNCVNLEELKNAEPMHYLTGVIVASVRGAQTSSSDQASFQIQGTLKDSSGNPIANAILSLGVSQSIVSREAVTTSTTTDANGNYTLNLKMGNFSVKVTNSSGVEIGSFRMNATSTTTKPEISVTSGNMSLVVNSITSPSPISPVTVAPSNLSYSSSTLNLTVGTAMTSLSPTVTGIVTSYRVSPALPSGLSLNSSTGVISGTPLTSVQSAIGYT